MKISEPTFKFLEVDLQGKDCDNSVDVDADNIFVVNTWDIGSKFDIIVEDGLHEYSANICFFENSIKFLL